MSLRLSICQAMVTSPVSQDPKRKKPTDIFGASTQRIDPARTGQHPVPTLIRPMSDTQITHFLGHAASDTCQFDRICAMLQVNNPGRLVGSPWPGAPQAVLSLIACWPTATWAASNLRAHRWHQSSFWPRHRWWRLARMSRPRGRRATRLFAWELRQLPLHGHARCSGC